MKNFRSGTKQNPRPHITNPKKHGEKLRKHGDEPPPITALHILARNAVNDCLERERAARCDET